MGNALNPYLLEKGEDNMYLLIIILGFILAMRGAKPAFLQKPGAGLSRIGLEAIDLFLTTSLVLTLWAFAMVVEKIQVGIQTYAVLGPGLAAYLLSRYQKKTDVFFLSAITIIFMVQSGQGSLLQGVFLAGVVSAGIVLFQASLLGLRYKLLFSNVPVSMKGWPVLCLLTAFISLVLSNFRNLLF